MEKITQKPTIASFLDQDFYKFTMGQWIFHEHRGVEVTSAFTNRTKSVKLAEVINESVLREQLDNIQGLKPTEAEINYLRSIKRSNGNPLFKDDYLNFLSNVSLPQYKLEKENGNYKLSFKGPWEHQTYWETFALSTMNELYYRVLKSRMEPEEVQALYREGQKRLDDKVRILEGYPELKFMEFGTRRRNSQEWQQEVVRQLKDKVPGNLVGTSNVHLARILKLLAMGTEAHERYMVLAALMDSIHGTDEAIRASPQQALYEWEEEYGPDLLIALTDTFGTGFFFRDFTERQANYWLGLRQDSGIPEYFLDKQVKFYKDKNVEPMKKRFVPSDGLEMSDAVELYKKSRKIIPMVAGIGTSITNDLGQSAVSMVVKAVEANGKGTVKLSDNFAKATGSEENKARYKRIFGYDDSKYQAQECKY